MTEAALITRSERLLALLVLQNMTDASQIDKCVQLNRADFSNAEIAELLDTSAATVGSNLYDARQAKGRKRSSKRNGKTAGRKAAKKATKKKATKRAVTKRAPKRAARKSRR